MYLLGWPIQRARSLRSSIICFSCFLSYTQLLLVITSFHVFVSVFTLSGSTYAIESSTNRIEEMVSSAFSSDLNFDSLHSEFPNIPKNSSKYIDDSHYDENVNSFNLQEERLSNSALKEKEDSTYLELTYSTQQSESSEVKELDNREDLFIDLYERRRAYITNQLYNAVLGTVQSGPFQGLKLVKLEHMYKRLQENGKNSDRNGEINHQQRKSWGDFDMASKLLGFYEDELYPYLEEIINLWKPDRILNIGCADGFYGIGLAKRLKSQSKIFMVDIVKDFLELAIENVFVNGADVISNTEFWLQEENENLIPKLLNDAKTPFLLVDCEGCELEYLPNPNMGSDMSNLNNEKLVAMSILKRSIILVEIHDFITEGIKETLIERFKDSHEITIIRQGPKDPYRSSIIHRLHDMDKWLIVNENRPETMYWLYMLPKSLSDQTRNI